MLLLGYFLNHSPRNPLPENYRPAEVAIAFNAYGQRIIAVRGNYDRKSDEMLFYFPFSTPCQHILLGERCRGHFNP
ncbi:hypothetical protein [Sodalis-like endosymbiont of Proechinophthirus fluctus]|uniref:hypothetical protein n=1 Tax=Sodalis-like endosymbiont of Proechinophthirus fluctus TaxID=1462730 RepID=UPI000A7A8430|nr:hypothetical protein [Sodalis-like endosymbiont of Proechinophthirus fluctus]